MNQDDARLMSAPSLPDSPFCCVCGDTYKVERHHVVRRSQGGTDGPTLPLCDGCHDQLHDRGTLTFDYIPFEGWVYMWLPDGEWTACTEYNEYEQKAPIETEDVLGSLAADLRELKCSADQVDYFLSRELAEAEKRLHGDRKRLGEWCVDNLDISPRSVDSYLSKRIAYASLPESCSTLGITNGYKVFLLAQSASLDDVLRDYHTMSRSQFNEQYGLTKHREKCTCPSCGASHTMKEE